MKLFKNKTSKTPRCKAVRKTFHFHQYDNFTHSHIFYVYEECGEHYHETTQARVLS